MSTNLDGWARALGVESDHDAIAEMQRVRHNINRVFQDLYFDVVCRVDFHQVADDWVGPSVRCAIRDLDAAVANVLSVENAFKRHERGELR